MQILVYLQKHTLHLFVKWDRQTDIDCFGDFAFHF